MAKLFFKRNEHSGVTPSGRLISVLSGKGGVGKSIIAMNLADQLSRAGHRTLLVDADFSSGDLHILSNRRNDIGVAQVITGQLSLREAVSSATDSFDLLAATGHRELADGNAIAATASFIQLLREQTSSYEFVILDHGSGVSDQAAVLAHASDLNVLVLLPELTSIADAFGLFKHVLAAHDELDCRFLVNRVVSAEEAEYIRQKFMAVTDRFLGRAPEYLGSIPEDSQVRASVAAQAPLAAVTPGAPASIAIRSVSNELVDCLTVHGKSTRLSYFNASNKTTAPADIRG
ncbi:MAG: AAA family ATPase [Candidatus Zixiibacteriota bacterium]